MTKTLTALLLTSTITLNANAITVDNGKVIRVIDGDTFVYEVEIWPDLFIKTSVRPRGIDTPELRGKCEEEKEWAQEAKKNATDILTGFGVRLKNVKQGKYAGRVVADVYLYPKEDDAPYPDAELSFSQVMIAAGLAREYQGGTRQSWCEE